MPRAAGGADAAVSAGKHLPAIVRDLNLIVDEAVHWSQLSTSVKAPPANGCRESIISIPIATGKDGAGKKRLLFRVQLRSTERTLTGDEADEIIQRIVTSCREKHGAVLLG